MASNTETYVFPDSGKITSFALNGKRLGGLNIPVRAGDDIMQVAANHIRAVAPGEAASAIVKSFAMDFEVD